MPPVLALALPAPLLPEPPLTTAANSELPAELPLLPPLKQPERNKAAKSKTVKLRILGVKFFTIHAFRLKEGQIILICPLFFFALSKMLKL